MSEVFSEYEYRSLGFIFDGEESSETVECIGSLEETMTVKTVTKKCRGVVRKSRSRGTGAGSLKITGHWPYDLYARIFGMDQTGLKAGVKGYGDKSLHPVFCVTADVFDEDDLEKYKAWPRCTVTADLTRKTTNGDEEVAEVELELSVSPDDDGYGLYEALAEGLDAEVKGKWLTGFTPALVKETT